MFYPSKLDGRETCRYYDNVKLYATACFRLLLHPINIKIISRSYVDWNSADSATWKLPN